MPVSLCEWRVRIGTFVHWIRDYEIRERKERLLKDRTRRIKVLCERLRAKQGVSEQESGDGSKTFEESKQGDCNLQDPTDHKVRSQCSHGTAFEQSSGNTNIKHLLTTCDHCIKDLLTPNDSHVKDVLAPSDTSIKELLTPTDSCIADLLLPSDVCQKDPHAASDSYSEDLVPDDCHVHELLHKSDSCIRGLLTASDSWEDVPLLSFKSCGNEGHTLLEPCNKDLLPAHDSFDTWSELQAQSGTYVNNSVNPKDSFIHELLVTRDPNIHNFLKGEDSHISKILTPKDSYIHELLMSKDCYTVELLKPANFSIKELFTSDSSGVKVPFCIDTTITDLPTSTEYCFKEHQLTSDSSISEQITPSSASKEHANLLDICTEEQNTLSEVVIEGQTLAESAVSSLSMLHDSCNIELLDNDVRMQGNLDQSCRKEQPTGESLLLAKSDDCTLNLPNKQLLTPTPLKTFVQHGLPNEEEISNTSSRSPCQSMASLNGIVDAVLPPHPCLNDLLLVQAGDVELNPGPLYGSIESVLQDSELVLLAKEVPGNCYTELCIGLGFSFVESQEVLTKHLMDIPGALIEFFSKWKAKQRDGTDFRAVLAGILGNADMGALHTKLLSGGYLPSKTSPSAPGLDTSPPLTREQVEHCGEDLRTFYCTRMYKIKTDPLDFNSLLEFENMYTNLTLLRNKMGARTTIPLDYTELFTTKMDGELPKRLLVEGEGGVGKTTFCAKMTWNWANGSPQFKQFSWVLAIPVCEIMKGQTVGDIVKNYLSDSNTVTPYQIDNYILSQPSKVLIILDGLDEYDGDLFADEHSHISQILQMKKYKECIVLVTTRPWKAVQFKSDKVLSRSYAFLTLQGFSPSNVSAYIKKYFADDDKAGSELLSFIQSNDVIRENMAPFPIYIAMLCVLWRDADSMKRATVHRLKTFSQLFDQMVLFLKDHYLSKTTKPFRAADLQEEMKRTEIALLQLGSLAFSGLLERKLAFREEDFISCKEAVEMCCRIGVLSQEMHHIPRLMRSGSSLRPLIRIVLFPHKLFQEYIAAVHLASLYDTDRIEYNRLLDKVTAEPEEFRYLLYFAAAQGKNIGLDITAKLQQTGKPSHFLVDIAFEAFDQDVAKLVGRRILPDKKTVTIDGGMSAHTVSGYLFIMQQHAVETLIVRDSSCGLTVSGDLAETISSSSSLSRLEFCRTTLIENFYELMSEQGLQKSSVRELHMDHKFLDGLQRFNVTIEDLFPSLDQLHFPTLQPVSYGIIKQLAHSGLAVLSIGQSDLYYHKYFDDGEVYPVPLTYEDHTSVGQLFLSSFPQLTSIAFSELVIGNIGSEAILRGLMKHLHLKSVRIIKCFTDDTLDPIAREISAKSGMEIMLQHDTRQSAYISLDGNWESRSFYGLSAPPEILARGYEAFRAYASALEDGKKKVFRTRLMLVGQKRVGKTSLKKSLTRQRFDPGEAITDGVETMDSCEITIEHIELDKDEEIGWSVQPKKNTEEDFVGEYEQVLADCIVSSMLEKTSQEQEFKAESSQASLEPFTKKTEKKRPYQEAGDNIAEMPEHTTQDKATSSPLDSENNSDIWLSEEEPAGAMSPVKDETETPRETIPDDIVKLVVERFKVEGPEKKGNERGMDRASLNIWDFAGHDIYYTTHQVFLNWRAIYVIVFDLSTDLDSVLPLECGDEMSKQGTKSELTCLQFIKFWLYSIYTHAVMPSSKLSRYTKKTLQKTPPIFIVGTHREKVKGSEREKKEKIAAAFAKIRTAVKGKPFECHVIPKYYQIENSLEGDEELDDLRKHIEKVAKDEPYMGEEIPLKWLKFEEFHAANTKNDMTLNQIKEQTQQIESENELLTMLNFYHDLGSIVYYGDVKETKSLLRDMVVLNPQWLIDVFKQVITILEPAERDGIVSDAWSTLEDYGILEDRLIQHMWQKQNEQKDALVELMMKFDLICKAPANLCHHEEAGCEVSDKTAKSPQKSYYVPSRLPPRCRQKDTSEVDMKSCVEFYLDFHRFLPEGLFHRLMARAVQWQMDRGEQVCLFYRQISMTVDDEHEALLTMLPPSDAAIKVNVIRAEMIPEEAESVSQTPDAQTPEPKAVKEVRDFATKTLDSLIQQLAKNLQYDLGFTCPNSKCSKMHFFKDCFQREFVKCGNHKFRSIGILRRYGYEKEVDALKEKYGPTSTGNPTSSNVKETAERRNRTQKFVTQKQLDTVSRNFPHEKFHNFSYKLGVAYNEADSILAEYSINYRKALMHILMAWKTKTDGPYSELVSALTDSEARDLVALIEPGGPTTSSGDDCGGVTRERAHVVATAAKHKDTMAGKREAMTEHEVRNVSPEEVSQPAAKKGRWTRVHSSSPDVTQRLHGTSPMKQGAQQQPGVEYTYNYSHECAQYEFDKEETQRARMSRSSHHHSAQPCEASMSDYQSFLGTPNPSYRYSQYDQSSSFAGRYSTVYQQSAQGRTDYSSQSWHDQPHHSGQYTSGAYFAHWSQSPQGSESWQPAIPRVQHSVRSNHPSFEARASFADRPGFSEHPHIPPYPHPRTYYAPLPFHQPVMSTGNHPQHQSSATERESSNWSTPHTANQMFPPNTFSSPIQDRTSRPSDIPGYSTVGTSDRFPSTFDGGMSRPYKRKAPCTQSRPPEDISENPEKEPHLSKLE